MGLKSLGKSHCGGGAGEEGPKSGRELEMKGL